MDNISNEEILVSILEDENDGDFSEGDLSLREAIALANEQEGEDTITFDDNLTGGTITLDPSQGELTINDSVAINGLGQDNLTLDGNFLFQIPESNIDVAIDGLNLTGGKIDSSGNLTFSNSTIANSFSIGTDGTAIISRGTLNVIESTIKDGTGGGNNGIVIESGTGNIERSLITNNEGVLGASGVIIREGATANISNSTITNNRDRSVGGVRNGGTVNISNSTIANNTGGLLAGGINNSSGGTVTLTSSLLANNTGSANIGDISGDGEFISGGNNLISNGDDAEGFVDGVNGDLVGSNGEDPQNPDNEGVIDARLGELQNNGGATETIALLEGSPAIDRGFNPNNLATDQRGEGFARTRGETTDIGAFEVQQGDGGDNPVELVVSTLEDESDGDFSAEDLSLREAIALANEQAGTDRITFNDSLSGGTIVFDESNERELAINDSVEINGLGQDNLTLDGGFIFTPQAGVNLSIDGLNLTGGKIDSFGNFTLTNSTISQTIRPTDTSGNYAIVSRGTAIIIDSSIKDNNGGGSGNTGIAVESGTTTIERSTIANNSSQSQSGIRINNDATVNLTNSTVANNSSRSFDGIQNAGTLNVVNSTIANNGGADGGGINNTGSTELTSTIVANNSNDNPFLGNGEFISGGNNLIDNGDNVDSFVESDLVGTTNNLIDPQLGELQDNGGATQTISLLNGSPAIDVGSNPNNLATDQRGEGFERTIGEATDIGAFEAQTVDNGGNEDNDNTIATVNESGISPDGQQNVVLSDAIAFNSDVDLFRLNLEAADVATFNIEAREFGSSLDSVVRVFDSQGNELAFDDDGNAPFEDFSLDSYLEFTAEADGEYYVGISSFDNFDYDPVNGGNNEGLSSGNYDLAISVFDSINGTQGADNLSGGEESDFIQGLDGNDTLAGNGDKDNLLGGSGNDVLTGGNGDDLLQGEAGFDVLRGENGNDTLGGGVGQNNLYGGGGNDIFAIGDGEDTVFDFQDGSDKLLLTGSLNFVAFEDLSISASDTGITIGSADTTFATLTGISPDQITADDLVSPNFLASTLIADDTAAIEAKAV